MSYFIAGAAISVATNIASAVYQKQQADKAKKDADRQKYKSDQDWFAAEAENALLYHVELADRASLEKTYVRDSFANGVEAALGENSDYVEYMNSLLDYNIGKIEAADDATINKIKDNTKSSIAYNNAIASATAAYHASVAATNASTAMTKAAIDSEQVRKSTELGVALLDTDVDTLKVMASRARETQKITSKEAISKVMLGAASGIASGNTSARKVQRAYIAADRASNEVDSKSESAIEKIYREQSSSTKKAAGQMEARINNGIATAQQAIANGQAAANQAFARASAANAKEVASANADINYFEAQTLQATKDEQGLFNINRDKYQREVVRGINTAAAEAEAQLAKIDTGFKTDSYNNNRDLMDELDRLDNWNKVNYPIPIEIVDSLKVKYADNPDKLANIAKKEEAYTSDRYKVVLSNFTTSQDGNISATKVGDGNTFTSMDSLYSDMESSFKIPDIMESDASVGDNTYSILDTSSIIDKFKIDIGGSNE